MDVEKVFGLVQRFFDQEHEPFVVVGGLAMLTYGGTRNTYDCDLLLRAGIRPKLRVFLEAAGYRIASETKGFSNHVHQIPISAGSTSCTSTTRRLARYSERGVARGSATTWRSTFLLPTT